MLNVEAAARGSSTEDTEAALSPVNEASNVCTQLLTSAPRLGSMLDSESMIGSNITSSSSALAPGAPVNGATPKARNAPTALVAPITGVARSGFVLLGRPCRPLLE